MTTERIVSIICVLGAGVVGFLLGDYRGEVRLQEAQLQAAVQRADDGRQSYERMVAAQDALDVARADGERMSRDYAERLRKLDQDRVRKTSVAACRDERAAVARCESLLREGAELLGEGRSLLQRNAAVHDALVRAR